mmetsp:Transcript_21018/g.68019  ORF Transcript_21018/g.68019 Transcript_21018/m.68019 type:complete len:239 (-) Transcript_21018:107-823(-)
MAHSELGTRQGGHRLRLRHSLALEGEGARPTKAAAATAAPGIARPPEGEGFWAANAAPAAAPADTEARAAIRCHCAAHCHRLFFRRGLPRRGHRGWIEAPRGPVRRPEDDSWRARKRRVGAQARHRRPLRYSRRGADRRPLRAHLPHLLRPRPAGHGGPPDGIPDARRVVHSHRGRAQFRAHRVKSAQAAPPVRRGGCDKRRARRVGGRRLRQREHVPRTARRTPGRPSAGLRTRGLR